MGTGGDQIQKITLAASSVYVRGQGEETGALNRAGKPSLVMRTQAGFSRRIYFCLRRHELTEEFRILVVNDAAVGGAEKALLFFLLRLLSLHRFRLLGFSFLGS